MPRSEVVVKRAQVREDTRQLLIAAAVGLLNDRGSAGLTMTGVARRADVAVRTVYNHFESVDELVAAALSTLVVRMTRLLPGPLDTDSASSVDALSIFVRRWFAGLAASAEEFAALLSVRGSRGVDGAYWAAYDEKMCAVRDLLVRADERGDLSVSLEDAVAVTYATTSFTTWTVLVKHLGMTTTTAADTVVGWVTAVAFRPEASLGLRTSQPGGRGDAQGVVEESPDSAGQGGG